MIKYKNTLIDGNYTHNPNLYDIVNDLELEIKIIRAIISHDCNDSIITVSDVQMELVRLFNIKPERTRIMDTLSLLRKRGYLK